MKQHILQAGGTSVNLLRELLEDEIRSEKTNKQALGVHIDWTRQHISLEEQYALFEYAKKQKLSSKIRAMFNGDIINRTEGRAVLHWALRVQNDKAYSDEREFMTQIADTRKKVYKFAEDIRSGVRKGYSGHQLRDVICVGIGGSYLGCEFVFEALKWHEDCIEQRKGRRIRFLANVDPIDFCNATEDLKAASTLVVIISKTFTTAETMVNAQLVKEWFIKELVSLDAVEKHFVAVTANSQKAKDFGLSDENIFPMWDWVGGRFSVTSAVGILPLSIIFGSKVVESFLRGCNDMDVHFLDTQLEHNLPVILGLINVYNNLCKNYSTIALIPYAQCLSKFVAHIQQVSMESNGKSTEISGKKIDHDTAQIIFGEPGTNSQHSFFQLLHQGREVPVEFVGFCRSQVHLMAPNWPVSCHDELMSNFFAQPDALAVGRNVEEVRSDNISDELVPHKIFEGNRPSTSILLPQCTPYYCGVLLAMYEHRIAVEGFMYDLNSFDQFGVELGKELASHTRKFINTIRSNEKDKVKSMGSSFFPSTRTLLDYYTRQS